MPKGIPNKRYTPELKQMAVEAVVKEGLSYNEAARIYGIDGHDCIQRWERICLTEGPEGLDCQKMWKKICWQKFSVCVRRMLT